MGFDYGTAQEVGSAISQYEGILGDVASILNSVSNIFSVAAMGVSAMVSILVGIVTLLAVLFFYIVHSIPAYALAKKTGVKRPWLVWIPVFHEYFRLFVLCDMAGDKPFHTPIRKFKFENRRLPLLIHIVVKYAAGLLVSIVALVISMAIPVVGSVSWLLDLLPLAVCGFIEYVYFYDVLNMFKDDKKSNRIAAIIVAAADGLLLSGLARTIYMYTMLNKTPLPVAEEIVVEEAPVVAEG